jgi:tetratricopeptide (TPR) repeat protein
LQNPDLNATYKNKVQAKITWFKPPVERLDKWFDFDQLFDTDNSLMYAQSFVNSPSDQTVYLRAGCSGSMKVWVNDQLVINESTERNCDLDIYTYKITLNKGYNRFLVQIGQSISGRANFMLRLTDDKATPIVGFSSTTQPQAYNKTTKVEEKNLPFFAENFFEDLIKKDAKSVADYVLLASVFNRNDKTYEAKKAIRKAREIMPNSTLISRINTEISIRESNRTELAKDAEFINSNDPTSNFSLTYQLTTAMSKQDYVEAAKVIEESKKYFGVNQATDLGELLIYARQNQMDNLLKAVDKVYKLYPNSYECIQMYCLVQIGVHKNTQAAIDAYKAYLDKNYNLTGIRSSQSFTIKMETKLRP